ncbi:poly-beta-hydroxybutyrate polymerase [Oceanicola sp. 22II-s10i]|nr:poly-beta-hydroxybutyrate polymerase [Oceanicola sp. 22II-s10i]
MLDRSARAALARATGGVSPAATIEAWTDWALHLAAAPGRRADLADKAATDAMALWTWAMKGALTGKLPEERPFVPSKNDHRFTHPGWASAPFALWQQGFLASQDWWAETTRAIPGLHPHSADRMRFMLRQMLDTASPSNQPALNPEIIEATRDSHGANFVEGAANHREDLIRLLTQAPKEVPEGYEIGEKIACTPGRVIYRNEIMELIQYSPQTESVRPEPVLIVPAWIMKYYILDLSPQNSLINWLVGQGHTVYCISWVNPGEEMRDLELEDYRKDGVMTALDCISRVQPGRQIHACGYCLGGTMLAITAATMARDGDDRLASVTLLAAQTDFTEAGELLLFLDESQVAYLEDLMFDQGYLAKPQMAGAFAAIRAEDLIWTRAVRRYFLGKEDAPTDIGVWNADVTRMPARMHSQYLRGLFMENRLSAGRFAVEGRVISLNDITAPLFIVGTESDHIAPWHSVYKINLFTKAQSTFVLTKGGHNGGIVSEPGHPGRHYRIGCREQGALYTDPDTWFASHDPQEGSWWPAWGDWLASRSGKPVAPPRTGAPEAGLKPMEPAPGTYIFQR